MGVFSGFFGWLRGQVKQAVLGGVSDAINELDNQEGSDNNEIILVTLQNRMKQLPAPTEEQAAEPTKKGKKA